MAASSQSTQSTSATTPAPFRVAVPQAPPNVTPPPAVTAPPSPTPESSGQNGRKFPVRFLLTLTGFTLLGFVRTPYQVGGNVTLEWPEGARQAVRSPAAATIEAFFVKPGDTVAPGQPLVQLSSRELDTEIASVQERIAQAKEQFQAAQREQLQAEARLTEIQAQAAAVQSRADLIQARLKNLEQGVVTPEIAALQAQRDRLRGQLTHAEQERDRYQALLQEGAVAAVLVEERVQAHRNLQHDLETKEAEIRLAEQRLFDSSTDEQNNASYQQASVFAATQIAQASDRVDAQANTIAVLENRLTELQKYEDNLVLTSTYSGTVLNKVWLFS